MSLERLLDVCAVWEDKCDITHVIHNSYIE